MKLKLNKKKLKNLSKDASILPSAMTPQVGGGNQTEGCSRYACLESYGPCPTEGICDATDSAYCAPGSEAGCASNACGSNGECGSVTCL